MSDERKYTQDEVNAILHRALQRTEAPDALSHRDLVETAKEVGITTADLDRAIVEEKKERAIQSERDLWLEKRKSRFQHAVITYAFVNAICLTINLLGGGPLWFYWVLIPWGLVLAMQSARLRTPPTSEELALAVESRARRVRRAERREQIRQGAQVLEEVVEHGVSAFLGAMAAHRKRALDPARRPEALPPGSDDKAGKPR